MMTASAQELVLVVDDDAERALPRSTLVTVPWTYRSEALGLGLEELHQLGAQDALGESGVVLDLGGDGELPTRLVAGHQRRLEVGAGGVERRGVARGAAADDGDFRSMGFQGSSRNPRDGGL